MPNSSLGLTGYLGEGKGGKIEMAGFGAYFDEFARTISIMPKI